MLPLLGGIICPLPKPQQSHDTLSGFRPITLLDCDLKLVMAVLTNRLQRPLDYLIDITQSAFLHGRDISNNVRYHLGLRARFEELGLPAWLLHSDLSKAYDTVNRPCLLRAMRQMGLHDPGIVSWIRLLMEGTKAQVRLNGALSRPFAIYDMSLPQGGAVSCPLWTIAGEVIVSYLSSIQHQGLLSTFPLPSGRPAPATSAFADDLTAPIITPAELSSTVRPAFLDLHASGTPAQKEGKTRSRDYHLAKIIE